MKLSISNIAWDKEEDSSMYDYLQQQKINGIEIAPTRIFESNPYDHLEEAENYRAFLYKKGIEVSSIQSIWYGRQENIFLSEQDMKALEEYTQKAILFAERLNCKNLVFGCPRNRNVNGEMTIGKLNNVVEFFRRVGEFAYTHNTCFSLEPNPKMYNTNAHLRRWTSVVVDHYHCDTSSGVHPRLQTQSFRDLAVLQFPGFLAGLVPPVVPVDL